MKSMMRALCVAFPFLTVAPAHAAQTGEEVYRSVCATCHEGGVDNAPRLGDGARWKPLIREGLNGLVPAALAGIRKMPAKGGRPELADIEVARAVVFMANAGGAGFAEPGDEDVARWRTRADRRKKR